MTKEVYTKIEEGLCEALDIAKSERGTYEVKIFDRNKVHKIIADQVLEEVDTSPSARCTRRILTVALDEVMDQLENYESKKRVRP